MFDTKQRVNVGRGALERTIYSQLSGCHACLEGEGFDDDALRRVHGLPEAQPRPAGEPSVAGWNESHARVTFYCPRALLDELQLAMSRSGRSKSRVIVDALRAQLPQQLEV